MKAVYPILEFDPERGSVIEPHKLVKKCDVPEHCVVCFCSDVLNHLAEEGILSVAARLKSEMGDHPVHEMELGGRRVAAFHPGIGASFAAAMLEEAIALGCRKFIVCGGCGVLDSSIPYLSLVEQMGIHRQPLTAFAPGSPAAAAYRMLWTEINTKLLAAD